MKKVLIILMMSLLLSGCGEVKVDNSNDKSTSTTSEKSTETSKATTTTTTTTTTTKVTGKGKLVYDKKYKGSYGSTYLIFTKDKVTINFNMCEGYYNEKFSYTYYTSKGNEYVKIKNNKNQTLWEDSVIFKVTNNTITYQGKLSLDCGNDTKFKIN